jgi:hypothetical protein
VNRTQLQWRGREKGSFLLALHALNRSVRSALRHLQNREFKRNRHHLLPLQSSTKLCQRVSRMAKLCLPSINSNQTICLQKNSKRSPRGEFQFSSLAQLSRSSKLTRSSLQWCTRRITKEITSEMAQRRHLREILGQTHKEKGRRRACEQSSQGIDDEAWDMSNHG